MPSLQDTYVDRQAIGFPGQKVDGREYDAQTMICGEAAGIGWGLPVARSGGDKTAMLLTAGNAAAFKGVSLRDVSVRPSAGDKFPQYENMPVLTRGPVFVLVQEAVAADDAPLFDTATSKFAITASATTVALPASWKFDSTAPANGLAVLLAK
jgi:hypothetical protein